MGIDLRIYLAATVSSDSWWSNTSIALDRENALWTALDIAQVEEPVPQFIEVYTYGADGNTKFVLDKNLYGERITYAKAQKLGETILASSQSSFNLSVGQLLKGLSEKALVVLYWH